MPEPAAQYCRQQSWRGEEAQVTDENGSFCFFSPAYLIRAERAWMKMQGNYELSHQEIVTDARGTTSFYADPKTDYK